MKFNNSILDIFGKLTSINNTLLVEVFKLTCKKLANYISLKHNHENLSTTHYCLPS